MGEEPSHLRREPAVPNEPNAARLDAIFLSLWRRALDEGRAWS